MKFDLTVADSKKSVVNTLIELARSYQASAREISGKSITVVANLALVDKAIGLAAESATYHEGKSYTVGVEKQFAYICYWMIKLAPISFIDFGVLNLKGIFSPNEVKFVTSAFPDLAVNVELSYYLFVMLFCEHRESTSVASKRFERIIKSKYSEEVIHSLRFHNYSARSMAMYLESLVMDKLG